MINDPSTTCSRRKRRRVTRSACGRVGLIFRWRLISSAPSRTRTRAQPRPRLKLSRANFLAAVSKSDLQFLSIMNLPRGSNHFSGTAGLVLTDDGVSAIENFQRRKRIQLSHELLQKRPPSLQSYPECALQAQRKFIAALGLLAKPVPGADHPRGDVRKQGLAGIQIPLNRLNKADFGLSDLARRNRPNGQSRFRQRPRASEL